MRVICSDLTDFILNLEVVDPNLVFEKVVWVDIQVTEKSEAVETVVFQASAIVRTTEGSEFLVQMAKSTGKNWSDSSDDGKEGTGEANRLKNVLVSFCNSRDLSVRPGSVSE